MGWLLLRVAAARCHWFWKWLLHNLWDGMFFAWLRKGNSCETCSLHTPSHGTTEPNMHLRVVQDIWAEGLHLQEQGSWLSLCVWWTVDSARSYFERHPLKECAERVSCCSYRKQMTTKSCLNSYFETEQLQLLETGRFKRAIWILQRFSLGLQTMILLARHSLARKKFSRSACVLCHFKGDALWPLLFIKKHRRW